MPVDIGWYDNFGEYVDSLVADNNIELECECGSKRFLYVEKNTCYFEPSYFVQYDENGKEMDEDEEIIESTSCATREYFKCVECNTLIYEF